MRKFISCCILVIAGAIVVLIFVTSTTYLQLAIAVVLYFLAAYFAFKIFPRKIIAIPVVIVQPPVNPVKTVEVQTSNSKEETVGIADIDKRTFLKLIGVSGLSLFLYWIFTKRAGAPIFGGTSESGTVSLEDAAGNKINPAEKTPTDGYKITEIDDSIIAHYGFTHKNGSWFIMRLDTDTGSFRYARGVSDFARGWDKREQLKYDYYVNVF